MSTALLSVDAVRTQFDRLGVKHVTDTTSYTLVDAQPSNARSVVIVASPSAIRDYDSYHPERILCILLRRFPNGDLEHFVITRDRDLDLSRLIPFWWSQTTSITTTMKKAECIVCFKKPCSQVVFCVHCRSTVCLACHERMYGSRDAERCASCRMWRLSGDMYGVPWDAGRVVTPSGLTPLDKLMSVLDQLDGGVSILPRIDRAFDDRLELRFCRLAFTSRYSVASDPRHTVHKKLKRLLDQLDSLRHEVLLYVIRTTHRVVDASRGPVAEVSLFQVRGDELLAYGNDQYKLVFKDDFVDFVKTELAVPNQRALPAHVGRLFNEINTLHPFSKTISVVAPVLDDSGMNFDVDANGCVTTMHPDMLVTLVDNLITRVRHLPPVKGRGRNKKARDGPLILVTCRIFRDPDLGAADFVVYALTVDSFRMLCESEARSVYESDVDGLSMPTEFAKNVRVLGADTVGKIKNAK